MSKRLFWLAAALVLPLAVLAAVRGYGGHSGGAVSGKLSASREAEPTAGQENEISAREKWFYHQRAWPAQHTPVGALARSVRQAEALDDQNIRAPRGAPTSKLTWARVGPQPIATIGPDAAAASGLYAGSTPFAGRVSAIATDPNNASTAWVGGAAGGAWKSTDGGVTWSPKFDQQPSLAIGAIAVDPSTKDASNNSVNIWVGTGEPNSSGDSYYGAGIYKSANGGNTWSRMGGASFLEGCFVFDLAIVNSTTVLAAVAEWPSYNYKPTCTSAQRGVWRTTNGGTSWTKISLPGSIYQSPTDFAQPTSPKATVYAATYNEGVWRSTDGGLNWSQLTQLVPNPSNSHRGLVSVAPSAANILYVAYATTGNQLAGVWKSANANTSTASSVAFTQTVPPINSDGPCNYPADNYGQCTYDFDLAVDPTDTTRFFLGGIRLFKFTSSGATRTPVGYGSGSTNIHVDQHALAYDKSNRLWAGSDGGVYRTDDVGASFINRNGSGSTALAISEFNGWTSGSLGTLFLGGLQDNGTVLTTPAKGLNWQETHGGDGGASAFQSPSIFYASYYGNDVDRTTDGGAHYSDISGGWAFDGGEFYPPMEMSPSSNQTLYRGTDRIWRTTNASTTASWTAISPHYTAVSAIGPAKSNSAVIYAGFDAKYSNGSEIAPTQIRYTTNATAASPTWTLVAAAQIPDRYITDFSVSPTNPQIAFATFSGFNAFTPTKPGHIFKTTNGGATWTNVSGNLPDTPVNAIFVDYSKTPNVMYAGTDIGVFWSTDGGASWGRGGAGTAGLPYAPVVDVRLDGGTLVAATHGRSAFKVPAPSAIGISSFTPSSGITGSNVTISGTNLLYTKTVLFGTKVSPSVSYSAVSQKVTAKVPDGATSAKITVKTSEGISAVSGGLFAPTLSITSVPATGSIGSTITINGIGLTGISAVKFNGTPAITFSTGAGSSSTAVIPAGATSGKVTVTTAAGTVQSPTSIAIS